MLFALVFAAAIGHPSFAAPVRVPLDQPMSDGRTDLSAAEAGRLTNAFSYGEVDLPPADKILVLDSLLRNFELTAANGPVPEGIGDLLESWATMHEIGRLPHVDFASDHKFVVTYATLRAYVGLELVRARAAINPLTDDQLKSTIPRLMYDSLAWVATATMLRHPESRALQRLGLRGLVALGSSPTLGTNGAVRDQFARFVELARNNLTDDLDDIIQVKTNQRKWRRLTFASLTLGVPLLATILYYADWVNQQPAWVHIGGLITLSSILFGAIVWMEARRQAWVEQYRARVARAIDHCERALGFGVPFSSDAAS